MKKLLHVLGLLVLLMFFCPLKMMGQDVIVLNDGSTIISKVLEVTPNCIKYKNTSNLKGPTYTLNVSNVRSINYANGERELFKSLKVTNNSENSQKSFDDSYINDAIISSYNDRSVRCEMSKPPKKIKWVYRLLNIHSLSKIGNTDGNVQISIAQNNWGNQNAYLNVAIENTSDEMMYIDLGSTSFRCIKNASTYFVNASKTQSSSKETGGSFNVGALTESVGIGGIIGTLAHGVNVGGGNTSGKSTTVYAERVVTVPPHSIYRLGAKLFYSSILEKPYKTDFKFGDMFKYNQPANISESPWEVIVSYAMEKDFNTIKKYQVGLFISEELSVGKSWDDCIVNETGTAPIHYYYNVK